MADSACTCHLGAHGTRRVVLTGGPGAGKTAVLEAARKIFCRHVAVLPEAASIVFGGGFPRRTDPTGRRASQRAIIRVQRELERLADEDGVAVALCDRGTLDGLAYWPGPPQELWADLGTTVERELARYSAVIHLRTPPAHAGYNNNAVRIESAAEAAAIDDRIARIWSAHPRLFVVENEEDFLRKTTRALDLLRGEIPECCRARST